ncbi:MAG TPA: GPW/gp25 family protein [Anaeromyxobacteraceae bacterium]|nr:GPW/gp25 family protein [Anaeromyxobacteraceae bacterium]
MNGIAATAPVDEGDLFGRGMAFPPRVGPDGRMAWSSGPENVREALRVVLLTAPGERVMLPAFGGGLRAFLHQPNVAATHRRIEAAIADAVQRWEPRVRLSAVDVAPADDDPAAAVATLRYALVTSGLEEQLRVRVQLSTGT